MTKKTALAVKIPFYGSLYGDRTHGCNLERVMC